MSETGHGSGKEQFEDFCRRIVEDSRSPAILVNPANAKILFASEDFGVLLKPNMPDAPRERLSDILKHGTQNEFREMMIDLLKEPESVLAGEIHLSGDLFLTEQQPVAMTVHGLDDFEYIRIEFTGAAVHPTTKAPGGKKRSSAPTRARVAELERLGREQELRYHRFIHVLGHELKSPLTAIKGYLELLEYQSRDLDIPDLKEILPLIISSLNRLYGSIEALYRLGNADLLDRRYKTTDLRRLLPSLRDELLPEAEKRGVSLVFDEKSGRLRLNPIFLREILHQLLIAQILYVKVPASTLQVFDRPDDEGYHFAVIHSMEGVESFPADFTGHMAAAVPEDEERKTTTFGYETARIFIEQTGGKIRFLRGENGLHSFYVTLPKGK